MRTIIIIILLAVIYNYHNKTLMMEAIIDGKCDVVNGQVYCK